MAGKDEFRVRMRQRLPVAMKPKPWLQMVTKEKPARNALGAMLMFDGKLSVAAYLGRQVHVIPIDKAGEGSSLWASLTEADRERLAVWLVDHRNGKFDAEISRAANAGW